MQLGLFCCLFLAGKLVQARQRAADALHNHTTPRCPDKVQGRVPVMTRQREVMLPPSSAELVEVKHGKICTAWDRKRAHLA